MDAAPTPPDLDGFEYQSTLGSGGFADVYRYRQRFPRRPVAIKVLRTTAVDRAARHQFIAEANTMAQLSSHPAIATVFSAGVTEDDRPYLVMEYCSRGSLGTAYRLNPLPLDQVLRIGIRIASALESAHRLGIVHRDVKPANILITDYGAAVLTDFGISVGGSHLAEATMMRTERTSLSTLTGDSTTMGLSVPWAPPEALDDEPVIDARSDVYSLAATLFTLFEGRSPFEHPGGSNGALHLSRRIERGALVPGERVDGVPPLSSLLRRAMSSDPADRPQSALEFATLLTELERENGLAATPIELLGDGMADPDSAVDPEETVVRVRPAVSQETQPRVAAVGKPLDEPADPTIAPVPRSHRRRVILIAAAVVVVLVAGGVGTASALGVFSPTEAPAAAGSPTPRPTTSRTPTPSPTPTAQPPIAAPGSDIAECPQAYLDKETELRSGSPSPTSPVTSVWETAILATGLTPYCGFEWGWQDLVFAGGQSEAAAISDGLKDAGYACVSMGDYWTTCQLDTRSIAINLPDTLNPNAYDQLPIPAAFTVESGRMEPCADDPQYNCILPW